MNILFLLILISNNLFSPPDSLVQLFRSPSYWKSYNEVYSLDVSEKSSKCPFALVEKNRHNLSTGEKVNVFTLKFRNNVKAVWDEKARYTGVYDEKADSFSVYDSNGNKLTAFPIRLLIRNHISYRQFKSFDPFWITDKKILFYLQPEKPKIKVPKNMPLLDSSPMPSYIFNIDWRNGKISKFFDLQKLFYDSSTPYCAGGYVVFISAFYWDLYEINNSKVSRLNNKNNLYNPYLHSVKSYNNQLFIVLQENIPNSEGKFRSFLFLLDPLNLDLVKIKDEVNNFAMNDKYILTSNSSKIRLFRRLDFKPLMVEKMKKLSGKIIDQDIFLFPYGDRILVIDDRTEKPTVIKIVE